MEKEVNYIEQILRARFNSAKGFFSFSAAIDQKSVNKDAWVLTFTFVDEAEGVDSSYQSKSQDRGRALDLAIIAVCDDKRTKIAK